MTGFATLRRSLAMVFWGTLVVFVDITVNGFDLVFDAAGWVLVAAGLGYAWNACAHPVFRSRAIVAAVLAWTLAVVALAELAGGLDGAAGALYDVAAAVQPVVVSYALIELVTAIGLGHLRRACEVATVALLAAPAVYLIVPLAGGSVVAVVLLLAVLALAAFVYYLVTLWRTRAAIPA